MGLRQWLPGVVAASLLLGCSGGRQQGSSGADAGKGSCDGGSCAAASCDGGSCPELDACVGGYCGSPDGGEAMPCVAGEDCSDPARPFCAEETGRGCVACRADADCAADRRCVEDACVATSRCKGTEDCSGGRVCDIERERCRACVQDGECRVDGSGRACVAGRCVFPCAGSGECESPFARCDEELGQCVECVEDAHCPAAHHCEQTRCEANCIPDSVDCEPFGTGIRTCSDDGRGHAVEACPAGETCTLTDGSAECSATACEPGGFVCLADGTRLYTCDRRGLQRLPYDDCTARDMECRAGACREFFCEAGEPRCISDTHPAVCSDDGWTLTSPEGCSTDTACDPDSGTCRARLDCEPDEPVCDGRKVTTCNDFGTGGLSASAQDCGEQTCIDGICADELCSPGEVTCDGKTGMACNDYGSEWRVIRTCLDDQYCSVNAQDLIACRLQTCTPGEATCDGTAAGVCNPEGSGLRDEDAIDCAEAGQACWQGQCKDIVCTGTSQCVENDVHTCIEQGTRSTLQSVCGEGRHCQASVIAASCVTNVCSPGAPACANNQATTCNGQGSGYLDDRVDCGVLDQACIAPMGCQPRICEPGILHCKGNDGYRCGPYGGTESLIAVCGDRVCVDGNCRSPVCTPGAPACDGTVATGCSDDGTAYVGARMDCATAGQICVDGACIAPPS